MFWATLKDLRRWEYGVKNGDGFGANVINPDCCFLTVGYQCQSHSAAKKMASGQEAIFVSIC